MQFIYLRDGFSYALNPVFDLIDQKPELIVGCILVTPGGESLQWFIDPGDENTARGLLDRAVNDRVVTHPLDAFVIVREPNTYCQLTVFAAVNCCNINNSGTGGRYGETLLRILAKHQIRTYPAEIPYPDYGQAKNFQQRKALIEECFWQGFDIVAHEWLSDAWGLEPGRY